MRERKDELLKVIGHTGMPRNRANGMKLLLYSWNGEIAVKNKNV